MFNESFESSNVVWVVPISDWLEHFPQQPNAVGIAKLAYKASCYSDITPYIITYDNYDMSTNPNNNRYTQVYINVSSYTYNQYALVWDDDPSVFETPREIDYQQLITHELGHILGFGDDTNSDDNIETIIRT
ncbi:MAG: hypothetical protein WC210_05405 [Candidatus Neomarinimicrobiota bacterium]